MASKSDNSESTSTPTGACACGAVTYDIQWTNPHNVQTNKASICHCTRCSAWSGGIFTYVEVYPKDGAVTVHGSEHLSIWKASDFGERAFCKICGSSMYTRLTMEGSPKDGVYHLGAGTLTLPPTTHKYPIETIQDEFFVDRKASAYTALHGTGTKMTSTEFFALWSDEPEDAGASSTTTGTGTLDATNPSNDDDAAK